MSRFTIRAMPVISFGPGQDEDGGDELAEAIIHAQDTACDPMWRCVMVIDQDSMVWAQFNMLWNA